MWFSGCLWVWLALTPVQEQQAYEIGALLRCPVCQGMPIAESPSPMAQDMMRKVREDVALGKSREDILGYFTQRYGEWVLLKPTTQGMNMLVWALPAVFFVCGVWCVWRYVRTSVNTGA
jgi:cytochrome c-type biogenesis protein CcmH